MLGMNVPATTMPLEVRTGNEGEPYAIRSKLGWLVYGLDKVKPKEKLPAFFCKSQDVQVIEGQYDLEQKFRALYNAEFSEKLSDPKEGLSIEDQKFLKIMDTTTQLKNGHYEIDLPIKKDDLKMPDNSSQAKGCLSNLGRRLNKNSTMHQQYSTYMKKLIKDGHAEKIPPEEIYRNDGRTWYIPHHGVYHPKKPEKLRVVFNCPITYKGVSLNHEILQGPDLTNRLLGVLLRWRKEEIAVTADIESMFYQVQVTEKDRDLLRFLWWPEGDLNKDPEHYRMLVHIFGATSSPSVANYALKQTAKDNEESTSKQVIEAIHSDFYADDFLTSVSTKEECIALLHEVMKVLGTRGFKLTKWISNQREVLESVPMERRATDVQELDLAHDSLPTERALGVKWDADSDELRFKMKG